MIEISHLAINSPISYLIAVLAAGLRRADPDPAERVHHHRAGRGHGRPAPTRGSPILVLLAAALGRSWATTSRT